MEHSVDHLFVQQDLPDESSIDQDIVFHNTPNMKLLVMYSPNIVSAPSQIHLTQGMPTQLMRNKGLCKLKEAVPMNIKINKTFEEIEEFIFSKAKNSNEYATFIANVISAFQKVFRR